MCCDCFISPCQVADSALQPPEPRQQGMRVCSPVRRGKERRKRQGETRCEWERGNRESDVASEKLLQSQCQWHNGLVALSLVHSYCKAESWILNWLKSLGCHF